MFWLCLSGFPSGSPVSSHFLINYYVRLSLGVHKYEMVFVYGLYFNNQKIDQVLQKYLSFLSIF